MKAKAFEYEVKKQLGNSCSVNGLLARCKNYPLSKAMVDHDHDRIKSHGGRLVMRSTESCLKGRETVDFIGSRGGTMG